MLLQVTMSERNEQIDRCQKEVQDCLVVGAGINGAVSAAALAGKGAKVTVIDKGDFASLTSQESSNLAWGGIKYLENYEFGLVWKLCRCRNELMELYPTQVEEIRFLTCIQKGFRKSYLFVYLGALLYWAMGRFKTRPPVLLSKKAIEKRAPMVNAENLAGGMEYSDCRLVENDARFTFGFIRSTWRHGGIAINYMELVDAQWKDGLWHAQLLDHTTGQTAEVQAKTLINAAGPFADPVNDKIEVRSSFRHILSKGVHLIVPQITEVNHVMAFFASDGRLFFMIPMGDRTCIGTTDLRVDTVAVRVRDEDITFILDNANSLLSLDCPLTPDDILATRCGVRPLVTQQSDDQSDKEWTALSRKHEIHVGAEMKMLSIYGGKLTDCINVGNEVADLIEGFGVAIPDPEAIWYGEPSRARKKEYEALAQNADIDPQATERLWRRYGHMAEELVRAISSDASLGEPLLEDYLRAEFHHVSRHEMVVRMEDFLRRRSMLALIRKDEDLESMPGMPEAKQILGVKEMG